MHISAELITKLIRLKLLMCVVTFVIIILFF